MASKADQKNEARLKREAAQAAAAAAAKRNRNLQILGGVIFSALVVVVLVVLISGGSSDKGPEGRATGKEVTGVQETASLLNGIEQNGFALGDPKAPVTIIEFLDVQCPFCKTHQLDEQPTIIKELVRTGKAKLRMAPVALPQMGEDSEAGRVVVTRLAAKGKAWDFLNLFFFNQGDEGTGYVTNDYLADLVAKVPGADAAKDSNRTADEEITKKLAEIDQLQEDLGVTGTPSFAIGRTGQEPKDYELLTLSGNASTADQVVDAVDELAKKAGV